MAARWVTLNCGDGCTEGCDLLAPPRAMGHVSTWLMLIIVPMRGASTEGESAIESGSTTLAEPLSMLVTGYCTDYCAIAPEAG